MKTYMDAHIPKPKYERKQWTHVLASDGKVFTSPAIARDYMNKNRLKGALTFVR